jgi:hypothetical protein
MLGVCDLQTWSLLACVNLWRHLKVFIQGSSGQRAGLNFEVKSLFITAEADDFAV